ncbi:MAG: ATP-binding protein [Chloroflexota bacterium]|jgi:serine/threonine-protein kinase RsbW
MKSLTLCFDPVLIKDLDDIRTFLEQAIALLGGSEDDAGDLVLAVNEAVTNVILHGYQSTPGIVILGVICDEEDLFVHLMDHAPLFDPTAVPSPDITLPLEERPLGGLGVHMMRQLCDELIYQVLPQGGNDLIFIKRNALHAPDN